MINISKSFWTCCLLATILLKCTQQRALDPKQQLYEYGYLNSTEVDEDVMKNAVKTYQEYFGLAMTGNLDESTMSKMSQPRCGMPDGLPALARSLHKWNKNSITYKIRNSTNTLTMSQVKTVLERSIRWWTQNVNLRISESQSDHADIDIYFNEQDGRGSVLGYAYYPENGDIYFDVADEWFLSKSRPQPGRIYACWLVAHELGHALGLDHVNSETSIMNPYYNTEQLDPSMMDINNLIHLYGGASDLDNTIFCQKTSIDAMIYTSTKEHILLKGNQYWNFTEQSLQSGPFSANMLFPGLPNKIDAAFSVRNLNYFLKDKVFYRFITGEKKYIRKLIHIGFENVPSNIDAAFFEPNDEIIYFFKGSKYYEFHTKNPTGQKLMVNGNRISENWNGVPNSIEAASYLEDNKVLFVKNSKCYTVNTSTKKLLQNQDCTDTFFKC